MINPNYIPDNLSSDDLELQKKQIKKSRSDYKKGIYTPRKKIKSFKSKKSGHIVDFQKRYSEIKSMNDLEAISKEFNIPPKSLEMVIKKGRGAFYSSGSRPNQSPNSWAYARLASTLLGRKACKVDRHIFKGTDITCKKLSDKYYRKTQTQTNTKVLLDETKIMKSYFRRSKNPIEKVKQSIKFYNLKQYDKIYGKKYGISALIKMGLVE
jgi:DNA polymerase III alpha subunit